MASDENTLDDTVFDMNKKKKSRKRINRDVLLETTSTTDSADIITEEAINHDATTEESDFTYEDLIKRAFTMIYSTRPPEEELPNQGKFIVPVPKVARVGTIRTSFANFGSICKYLKRQEKSLYDYFLAETGQRASIDKEHALVIRGRYSQRAIESILSKFIKEYVICKTCHSPHTLLGKSDRLTVVKCETCHSQYSVSSIKTGFNAQVGRRPREN